MTKDESHGFAGSCKTVPGLLRAGNHDDWQSQTAGRADWERRPPPLFL
jgi:hypothetical protein